MSVLLKKPYFKGISQKELAAQLEAKKKSEEKLPTWFNSSQIYYSNKLNIEQSSSEKTAEYKARLVDGKSLLDLTGGFGVDSFYFSKKIEAITHCEMDKNLSDIAAHNFKKLGITNCDFIAGDGIEYLEKQDHKFDWIYADPSRRNDLGGRVFKLQDCQPNIPEQLEALFEKTENILLKTAPLLDLSLGINELEYVKAIYIVAVKNEVKELLWILKKGFSGDISTTSANLQTEQKPFSFLLKDEKDAQATYDLPKNYLFEPNAAILKAGAFKLIGNAYNLKKLHEHTHLYTSNTPIDFPGRVFKIETVFPYSKKALKALGITNANVTVRNFPESVASIRKKHKIADGGQTYLFFTKDFEENLIVLICSKITHMAN